MAPVKKSPRSAEEAEAEGKNFVEFGSPEHEAMLAGGYGMTLAEARAIIQEREQDPLTHPYEVYKNAKAMIAAFETRPVAIAKNVGWELDDSIITIS